MKKLLSSALFLFAMIFMVGAQNATLSVSGHVTDDVTGAPIQNHLVLVSVLGGGMYQDYEFYTNDAGFYGSDSIPATSQGLVRAATFDCIGEEHAQEAYFYPGNYSFVFDFEICNNSIPQGDCENWFIYETWNNIDFTFIGESMPPANAYFWDFGDGNTGTGQMATHSYNINDLVYVTLTTFVYDPATGDSCVATSTQEVWVGTGGGNCIADFDYTIDSVPTGAYVVQFTDLSIGNPTFWMWDFGDGGFSEEQNPEHIYDIQGTYLVCLTIFSDSMNNCYDTYCEELVLGSGGSVNCQNWFWYETNDNVTFDFYGESFPYPANEWIWDFGDGEMGYGQNITHTYDTTLYNIVWVTLTTVSYDPNTADSCIATSTQVVWVGNQGSNCQANFEYTIDSVPTGAYVVQFTDLSIGDPTFWMWDFGDGGFSEEQNPEHIYDIQGTYLVCLTIFSDSMNNCYDTYCEEIVLGSGGGGDCENWFWYETNDNITFDFYGESFPFPAFYWMWDFGDGATALGQNVTHTYDPNTGDIFIVTLTTISTVPGTADTCIAYSTQEVWVGTGGGNCIADFDYTIDSVPTGAYVVQFTDLSIGNPTFWMWDFGDGGFSEEQNPEHIYDIQGTYLVCLTIFSDSMNNCYDTYCEEIVLGSGGSGNCQNWFWYNTYDNITFNFYGEAFPIPADDYYWDFGDGSTGSGQEVIHTYDPNTGDVFIVSLTTVSYDPATGDSCIAYSMQQVWVGNGGNDCENWFWYDTWDFLTFDFYGESYPFPANDYFWDFGDGETGYGQIVEHTYDPNNGDVFLVTLTTYSLIPGTADTCVATSVQEVWVGGQGNDCENWFWYESYGDFTYDFWGESFPLPAYEYIWDFGDGSFATGQQVTHTFDPSLGDEFLVCLTTYSYDPMGDSCIAESCQEIFLSGQMGHELFGTVFVENSPVDYALVGLFGIDNAGWYIYDFTMTDEGTGAYFFEDVPNGDYYIWASLLPMSQYYWQYFPTYYGDALSWEDAELITLGEPNNPYDINLIPVGSFNAGPGNITGTVSFDNGKGPGDNVNVVLMDEEENALSYILSNEEGLFEFEDMAYGTYKLKVEMPGVNSEIATVVLDENNQTINVEFIIKGSSAYLSIDNLSQVISGIGEIYPNPVSDYANIEVILNENSNVTVIISNQLGQVVYTSDKTLVSGKQLIKLNTSELPEGFYNVQFRGEKGGILVKKFIKVK